MRFLSDPDPTNFALQESVVAGEYSTFGENFVASYNSTKSIENAGSEQQMFREVIEPIYEVIMDDSGMTRDELMTWIGDPKFYLDEQGNTYTGRSLVSKRIWDYAQNSESAAEKLKAVNPAMINFTSPQILHENLQEMSRDVARDYREKYEKTALKQSGKGVFGDFLGSMTSYMTDPADAVSLLIGYSRGVGFLRKVAEASAINVGVEALDYPQVNAWKQQVLGEPYTLSEFAQDAGYITAGTAALVGVTSIPVRQWLNAISNRAGRALTPKEELDAIELFREIAANEKNVDYKPFKETEQANNKDSADKILEDDNYIKDDSGNIKHNRLVQKTLSAILRNDANNMPQQNVQIKIDDIYALEKQNTLVDEFELADLKAKVKASATEFDPIKSGHILIFEDAAGKRIIIDGNQRVANAAKAGQKKIYGYVIKETDGFTKEMAEMAGRIRNYYDGTIKPYDMKILEKYPDMVTALSTFDPLIKHYKAIMNLGPRPLVALKRGLLSEEIGMVVGKHIVDPQEQLAMMDMIIKSGITDVDDIERMVIDAVESKALVDYDMVDADIGIKSLFVEPERKLIIDRVLKDLKKETNKLKRRKDKQANLRSIETNEKIIEVLKKKGNEAGEISNIITRGAQAISNGGEADNAVRSTIESLRSGFDEGRFDSIYNSGRVAESNATAQINKFGEQFRQRNRELMAYAEGQLSKQIKTDVDNAFDIIQGRLADDDAMAARVIDFDADGNPITMRQALADIADDDAKLEILEACAKK
jgi:hypothetical protein